MRQEFAGACVRQVETTTRSVYSSERHPSTPRMTRPKLGGCGNQLKRKGGTRKTKAATSTRLCGGVSNPSGEEKGVFWKYNRMRGVGKDGANLRKKASKEEKHNNKEGSKREEISG